MNVIPQRLMTVDEFLVWAERRPGLYEPFGGGGKASPIGFAWRWAISPRPDARMALAGASGLLAGSGLPAWAVKRRRARDRDSFCDRLSVCGPQVAGSAGVTQRFSKGVKNVANKSLMAASRAAADYLVPTFARITGQRGQEPADRSHPRSRQPVRPHIPGGAIGNVDVTADDDCRNADDH